MSKELIALRILQFVISVNTLALIFSIFQAKNGAIKLHRKINTVVVSITLIGVAILSLTVALGWDYQSLTTPQRMKIHRCFSCPLALLLPLVVYFGWTEQRQLHLRTVYITVVFWLGTLITGIWFF